MSKLTGIIVTPDDTAYHKAKKNYNLALPKHPCIIVYCLEERDVINAIKYAREKQIDFRIRSGRHDFEANSNVNYGLVIDMSEIKYVVIDEANLTVTVGGGILAGEIYSELVKKGYTIPAGTCKDVGAAGLTSVGGVGYATRQLGLTLDSLIEATLIDYQGNQLMVNKTNNEDLFWAIKGAPASSFGVITSLKYKIYKVDKVSFFTSKWYEKDYVELVETFQTIAAITDNRLTLNMEINKNKANEVELVIDGQFFGLPNELSELLKPFFSVGEPKSFEAVYVPYEKVIETWEEACYPPNRFKNSGAFLYDTLDIEAIQKIIAFVKNAPEGFLHYLEWIPLGGEVRNVPSASAAFAHREARFLTQIKSIWETEDQAEKSRQWTNEFKRYLDTIGEGNYRGFTDFNLVNWQYQYYRDNYSKLQNIKDKYDPENLFRYFQGIQPAQYGFEGLTGKIITPNSVEYEAARKDYNLYFDFYPTVIVYAYEMSDVQNAIEWADSNDVGVTVRCGGHNYEAFSVSNYTLLLDISNIKKLYMDKYNHLVTIGAGYNLGELYTELYHLGYQFTGGTCPGVGISGLVSGGGLGLSARMYGLACDNLVALKLVNAYGEIVIANDCENSDLFWACRGAGGANFGVFVEFTFRVRPVDKITYIEITWPKEERFKVIDTYQKFMLDADKRVTLELSVSKLNCKIGGFSYATEEETKKLIEPILQLANATETTIAYIPFIDAVNNVGQSQLPPNRFKNSGAYIYELLPEVAINKILNHLDDAPSSGFAHSILVLPGGGEVAENACLNTSYAHRQAQLLLQYISRWNEGDDAAANIEWIRQFRADMSEYAYNAYVNFPDLEITDYLSEYYDQNTKYLKYVKNKYNPTKLFNFPQSL